MMHARALARMSLVAAVLLGGCGGPAQAPEESPDSPEAATPAVPESAPESAPAAAPAPETPAAAAEKIAWRPDLWKNPPLGLPPVPDPQDNRMSAAKVELGRQLYFDRRLSKDGSVSCASCHHPTLGFSNAQRFSPGIGGQVGTRNSPTVYNVAYAKEVFWDGRAETLEAQAIGPILNPIEMGNTVEGLLGTLAGIAEYTPLFEAAFGAPAEITEPHVVQAIAAFERTILSGDAPYDRFRAGDQNALSPGARRGLAVFEGQGRCILCHSGASLTDNGFHNIGVGTGDENADAGRMAVTKQESDWAKFKTPTLRNIAVTGPYMHDGSMQSLEEVVAHYVKGGIPNRNLDPLSQPLDLTDADQADLVTFLKEGLTREIEVPIPDYGAAAIGFLPSSRIPRVSCTKASSTWTKRIM